MVTPEIFVVAPAASETPTLLNSTEPILSLIMVAFFCSDNNAVTDSLLVVPEIVISFNETPSLALNVWFNFVSKLAFTITPGTSTVL